MLSARASATWTDGSCKLVEFVGLHISQGFEAGPLGFPRPRGGSLPSRPIRSGTTGDRLPVSKKLAATSTPVF